MTVLKKKKVVIIAAAGIFILFLFALIRGPEDDWICQDGQWVQHGKPWQPSPTGSCGNNAQPKKPEGTIAIETKSGENFSLVLETNPTTGYGWEPKFDPTFVQLVDRKYVPLSQEPLLGQGGKETFSFLALTKGETQIRFSYVRPWEKEKAADERIYKILIKS